MIILRLYCQLFRNPGRLLADSRPAQVPYLVQQEFDFVRSVKIRYRRYEALRLLHLPCRTRWSLVRVEEALVAALLASFPARVTRKFRCSRHKRHTGNCVRCCAGSAARNNNCDVSHKHAETQNGSSSRTGNTTPYIVCHTVHG